MKIKRINVINETASILNQNAIFEYVREREFRLESIK